MDVFSLYAEMYEKSKVEEISLQDYLLGCRDNPLMRATAAERMMAAIGEGPPHGSRAGPGLDVDGFFHP